MSSTSWSGPVNGSVCISYNSHYRITEETVNWGDPITFAYQDDHLLTQVCTISLTRLPQTSLLAGSDLDAVSDAWSYNPFGEVDGYNAVASGSDLFDVADIHDDMGELRR